jgi:hypothetical protein
MRVSLVGDLPIEFTKGRGIFRTFCGIKGVDYALLPLSRTVYEAQHDPLLAKHRSRFPDRMDY